MLPAVLITNMPLDLLETYVETVNRQVY